MNEAGIIQMPAQAAAGRKAAKSVQPTQAAIDALQIHAAPFPSQQHP